MGNVKKIRNLRNLNLGVRNYMLPTLKGINKEGYAAMEKYDSNKTTSSMRILSRFPYTFREK